MFDSTRLQKGGYDLNNPLDSVKFQRTVEVFMALVRSNKLQHSESAHKVLVDQFCDFVDNEEVWCLAQSMIPEFRLAKEDQ